jgi:hypothetical protein
MKAEGEGGGRIPVTGGRLPFIWIVCGIAALSASLACAAAGEQSGAPYVPTSHDVVEAMLKLARVGPRDFVVDLGSGDGRIVIAAATRYRARGMGVDIDPDLVKLANAEARRLGVADRVSFLRQDLFTADLNRATVLTLYLLPETMTSLRPKLLRELAPGVRIVSHDFDFGEWKPDRSIEVTTAEKYDVPGTWSSVVHLWTVPAAIEGVWSGEPGAFRLEIVQRYQQFEGRLTRDGQSVAVRGGRINGTRVRFTAAGGGLYLGRVRGDRMTGEIREGDGTAVAGWSATRVQ